MTLPNISTADEYPESLLRWISVHTDEVYFRDAAHGFLAWAVAAPTAA